MVVSTHYREDGHCIGVSPASNWSVEPLVGQADGLACQPPSNDLGESDDNGLNFMCVTASDHWNMQVGSDVEGDVKVRVQ